MLLRMSRPTVISLFTGAGGLDYGFEAAGFRTDVALEIDTRCCETLDQNGRGWPIINEDIAQVTTKLLLSKAASSAVKPTCSSAALLVSPFPSQASGQQVRPSA
jgi:site-specific DNA-cytosine methylase